ncbi:MAG: MerR family transcriptional regulator [Butyrivibrio sp.]|nr:MerR family transcriptional regulator [Butyrivibrio sp.]
MATDKIERKIPMYVLTQEQINQIAAVAGEEAVKRFRAEQVKSDKKRAREENKVKKTKKMLSSYRRIKATLSDEAEFTEEEQIELRWKFIQDLMGSVRETVSRSERTIKDEEKRRQEDLYCIYRIEKATEMYREECEKSGSEEAKRRYRELSMMYLEEQQYSVQEISEVENVSDKTVYKDLGIACGIVAVYLLGI